MAVNYQGFQQQSPPAQNMFQTQQFFPQPQGNIYLINNFLEMANVPTGIGISAALCLSEGVMYLKTIQNGQPVVVGYKIGPLETEEKTTSSDNILERLQKVEKQLEQIKQKPDYDLKDLI